MSARIELQESERGESGPGTARATIALRVDYEKTSQFFTDYAENLSRGETFIKTARPLPVGTRCTFSFTLPALPDPLEAEGEVTFAVTPESARGKEPGMRIRLAHAPGANSDFDARVRELMQAILGAEETERLLGHS